MPKRKKPRVYYPDETTLIYRGLYEWYLEQTLSLTHLSQRRSHFCLLYIIQKYLDFTLLEHSQDNTSVALPEEYRRDIKCFGRYFNTLFETYFENTIEFSHTHGAYYSHGYQLREPYLEEIYTKIYQYFDPEHPLESVKINASCYHDDESSGKKILEIETVANEIAYSNNFSIPEGYFLKPIAINRTYLQHLIIDRLRDKRALLLYMELLNVHHYFPRCMYRIGTTGRWFGTTKVHDTPFRVLKNYQGMKKVYRKDIFHNMYEYDISTAAPTILLQIYSQYFADDLSEIQNYIDNKTVLRRQWAALLGDDAVNLDIVKATITSLFFGAKLTKPQYISEQVQTNISKEKLRALLADRQFKAIVDETTYLFKQLATVLLPFEEGHNEIILENLAGIEGSFTKKEKNKAIAHIYQGIEVSILKSLSDTYTDDIVLFIHDAIISKTRLNTNDLVRIAHEATGYIVQFEEEEIS